MDLGKHLYETMVAMNKAVSAQLTPPRLLTHAELETRVHRLQKALEEIRELFVGEVDVTDTEHGPIPNRAMLVTMIVDDAMGLRP